MKKESHFVISVVFNSSVHNTFTEETSAKSTKFAYDFKPKNHKFAK